MEKREAGVGVRKSKESSENEKKKPNESDGDKQEKIVNRKGRKNQKWRKDKIRH